MLRNPNVAAEGAVTALNQALWSLEGMSLAKWLLYVPCYLAVWEL